MKRFAGMARNTMAFMVMIMMFIMTPAYSMSASAYSGYSGGFFDDGLYDDDWYVDYYEQPTDDESRRSGLESNQEQLREYEASQLYDDAEESGIFNF